MFRYTSLRVRVSCSRRSERMGSDGGGGSDAWVRDSARSYYQVELHRACQCVLVTCIVAVFPLPIDYALVRVTLVVGA